MTPMRLLRKVDMIERLVFIMEIISHFLTCRLFGFLGFPVEWSAPQNVGFHHGNSQRTDLIYGLTGINALTRG